VTNELSHYSHYSLDATRAWPQPTLLRIWQWEMQNHCETELKSKTGPKLLWLFDLHASNDIPSHTDTQWHT